MERATGRIIATLRGKYLPHDLARYLQKIGEYYNNALIVVERNTGHAVLNELIRHTDYRMIYYHREYDQKGQGVRRPGFPTTPKTRGMILADLEKTIEDRYPIIPDIQVIEECLNFGYDNGKAQAIHGNDDCVMALAIGNYLCQQPTSILMPPDGGIDKPRGM